MIEITPQNDISTIWGNPYLRVIRDWQSYPHQKQIDLIHGMQKLGVPQGNIGLILREPSIEGALRELHREAEYGIAKERREESTFRRLRSEEGNIIEKSEKGEFAQKRDGNSVISQQKNKSTASLLKSSSRIDCKRKNN